MMTQLMQTYPLDGNLAEPELWTCHLMNWGLLKLNRHGKHLILHLELFATD